MIWLKCMQTRLNNADKRHKRPKLHQWKLNFESQPILNEVPTQFLLPLDGLEQWFEVSGPKPLEIVPLNNLDENRGAVH